MVNPILATKLYIPPSRPELVPRPHLIERLNEGLHRKLTLVSAPAGFGKTTLVSNWLNKLPGTDHRTVRLDGAKESEFVNRKSKIQNGVAWLSLDDGDNDLARFLAYMVAALETVERNIGQKLMPLLQSPQLPPIEHLITLLINDLVTLEGQAILALDDYHLLENRDIHRTLTFMLDHLPPQLHLVIASRTEPDLPVHRLRVGEQMNEIGASDLRFTMDEAGQFFNQTMHLNLTTEDITLLEQRTEGWIAGLKLAALSMEGQDNVTSFIRTLSGDDRYILDFLVAEVLQHQEESVQSFLLQTSILERMNSPLCEAITGQAEGQANLERLDRSNLFLIPLDNKRQWYRYHHLFGAALQARLQQQQPEKITELHRRASQWLGENGFEVEAIQHALAGQDYDRAANLLERIGRWMMSGELPIPTILGWLEALPDDLIATRPKLCLLNGWWLVWSAQFEAAEQRVQAAEQALQNDQFDDPQPILGEAAAVRTNINYATGQIPATIDFAQQSLDHLPDDDWLMRSLMAVMLGHAHRLDGNPQAALQAYRQTIDLPNDKIFVPGALISMGHLIQLDATLGRIQQADHTYKQIMRFVSARQLEDFPATGITHVEMGAVLYERNDLDGAIRESQRGIALCQHWEALLESSIDAYITLARVKQAQGDSDGVVDALHQAIQLGRSHNLPQWTARAEAIQARLWLWQGNIAATEAWASTRRLANDDDLSYLREVEHLTFARLLIAQEQTRFALTLLDRLLESAQKQQRLGSVLEIHIVQALAFQAQNQLDQALTSLASALELAGNEGYTRLFVDEGQPMLKLLQQAASQGVHPATVVRLLAEFSNVEKSQITNLEDARKGAKSKIVQPLIDPLSQRELEVLRLITQGYTNQEIAENLFVAVSTVKKHINHIYGKLNVRTRTQAMVRARELKLL